MSNDIYTYLKENFNIKITDYQFKRDYILNPLKKIPINTPTGYTWELPEKEDLEYLYIFCNIKVVDLTIIFNISNPVIQRTLRKYNIKKDKNKIYENICKEKLEKYNDKYFNNRPKAEETMMNLFGKKNFTQTEKYIIKAKNTNQKKYKVDWALQSEEIKEKIKKTCMNKLGVENPTQAEQIRQKAMMTKIGKYNDPYYNNREKCFETMRKNGTFGRISKPELECINLLKTKYTVLTQYDKDKRYPYHVDGYIVELDIFFEYQGFGGGHNGRPFLGTKEDIIELELHKEKAMLGDSFSKRIIRNWGKKDIEKRECAKRNKLNYVEVFNMEQFKEWFNSLL